MKKFSAIISLVITSVFLLSCPVFAETVMGTVTPATPGVDIQLFGSMRTFPHFVGNLDFNDDHTEYDWILDESGIIDNDEVTVRNEFRLGVKGGGENWKFLAIMESDFALDKGNVDRGSRAGEISNDLGMTGEDFGVEKLEFSYDFSSHGLPAAVETGWNTTFVDLETGGLFYGDDHPYFSLAGGTDGTRWEILALLINDTASRDGDSDENDWQVYTAKITMPVGDLKVCPFYGYSDNQTRDANVHYLGVQAYGTIGGLTPKAEFVYALGRKDNFLSDGNNADISAFGGFASIEAAVAGMCNPYFGGYYISGDDNAADDKIKAFNPITNIARYAGPFGMENAFIYRYVPVLGTHLYSNSFDTLGAAAGYGGISNSASADSPGMINLGIGAKGAMGNWSYKAQFIYFWFEETAALEDIEGRSIDNEVGFEFDLQVTYRFSKHFSLGNVVSIFDPGNGIQDLRGEDFDQIAFVDAVEFQWTF